MMLTADILVVDLYFATSIIINNRKSGKQHRKPAKTRKGINYETELQTTF
jgi:hypothetical protein